MNETLNTIFITLIQLLLIMGLSPLINMLLKKWKANAQGRQGPPVLQGYYDLLKYFRKETVVSNQTSWLFLFAPLMVFASTCGASLLIPTIIGKTELSPIGGLIVFVYLLGLGRFFLVSAAMEPGSGFCGMASSREMMLSTLVEPVMLLSLFVFTLLAGTTDLFNAQWILSNLGLHVYTPAYTLALVALFIAALAETGRIPFDNPETHYELTMIHEGMLLDYSGQPLGLMLWAAWSKQLAIFSLLANLLFPWGLAMQVSWDALLPALILYVAKLLAICLLVVFVETTVAKMRLFRVKDILGTSFIISIIALIFAAQQIGARGGQP